MKIVITGGAGFIGSNLCEYFVGKGYDVICLDKPKQQSRPKADRSERCHTGI